MRCDPLRHTGPWLLSLALLGGCSRDPLSPSAVARQIAERFCPLQGDCGCEQELLIPNCEREVVRAITRSEQEALEAGLFFDQACLDGFLAAIDTLSTCTPTYSGEPLDCTVYYGTAGVGEPCRFYEFNPTMTDCQQGLECRAGACRDVDNPIALVEGEICSDSKSWVPTGFLGECAAGLVCDAYHTRTCISYDPRRLIPLGGVCTGYYDCEQGAICRPPEGMIEVSEQVPGVCTPPTPAGEPCTFPYECERLCEDGRCQIPPPRLCEVLDDWPGSREVLEQEGQD